jgi:signal transduction histidine kinase
MQLDVWAPQVTLASSLEGPRPVLSVCWLVSAGVLVWRHSRPLGVTAVVVAFYVLLSMLYGPSDDLGAYLPFFAVLFSLAVYATRGHRVVGVGLVLAGFTVGMLRDPTAVGAATQVRFWFFLSPLAVTFVLGALFRIPRQRAHHLQALATQLDERRRREAAQAVVTERARIARELHDVVAHSITTMIVQAGMGEAFVDDDPDRARRALGTIGCTGREALAEMRRLLGLLRSDVAAATLSPQPGLSCLGELVKTFGDSGLSVTVEMTGDPTSLGDGLDLAAFRIIQEALTNTLKHAESTRADVRVVLADDIDIEVTDDGTADATPRQLGHGLVGMAERVALYRGEMETGPMRRGGFRVHARMPVDRSPS